MTKATSENAIERSGIATMLDEYALKARLWPALLIGLPAAGLVGCLFPNSEWWHPVVAGSGATVGLTFLLAQMARSAGKRKQPALHARWSGKPTTRYLRYRDSPLDRHSLNRYHRNIERISGGDLKMPTAEEEAADPIAADAVYEAATRLLIAKTRDTRRFRLLFRENIHYGFCRNLWGLKPVGIGIAAATAAACAILLTESIAHGQIKLPAIILVGGTSVIWLLLWSTWLTADWVRVAADAYAERLLEASDSLVAD